MDATSVTRKGQVTIPKSVRERLGIRTGSRIEFTVVDDHIELRVSSSPSEATEKGFGMLKSPRPALPADYDPAELLK